MNSFTKIQINTAVILAGGFGTRLRARTHGLPKCLVKFEGIPFLAHQIKWLQNQGFQKIYICTHFQHDQIHAYISENTDYEGIVVLSREHKPLGTGGAVKHLLAKYDVPEYFLVVNGDTFFNFDIDRNLVADLLKFYPNILWGSHSSDAKRFGNINVEGNQVIGFAEKEETAEKVVNCGCYILAGKEFSSKDEESFSLEKDLFPSLAQANKLGFLELPPTSFYDFGTVESFDTIGDQKLKWLD